LIVKQQQGSSKAADWRPGMPTAALLLLYCCFTAALLLLYCCFTAALLLLYCCFTAAVLLLYCCFTAALLLLYWHSRPPVRLHQELEQLSATCLDDRMLPYADVCGRMLTHADVC
jgi:hypothetical protein